MRGAAVVDAVLARSKDLLVAVLRSFVRLGTLPYYRWFEFNTLRPIRRIASCSTQSPQSGRTVGLIVRWRMRKMEELRFISIACALLVAAVIGSFSWNGAFDVYWLAPALWYGSLVLAILGLLLSAQQIAVLHLLEADHAHGNPPTAEADVRRYLPLMLTEVRPQPVSAGSPRNEVTVWQPRWKMMFTWQCPIMFMSYSVCFYLTGLTIYVCTPLIRREKWNGNSNAAMLFLTVSAIAGGMFMFCSFWVYHYVDFEPGSEDVAGTEMSISI